MYYSSFAGPKNPYRSYPVPLSSSQPRLIPNYSRVVPQTLNRSTRRLEEPMGIVIRGDKNPYQSGIINPNRSHRLMPQPKLRSAPASVPKLMVITPSASGSHIQEPLEVIRERPSQIMRRRSNLVISKNQGSREIPTNTGGRPRYLASNIEGDIESREYQMLEQHLEDKEPEGISFKNANAQRKFVREAPETYWKAPEPILEAPNYHRPQYSSYIEQPRHRISMQRRPEPFLQDQVHYSAFQRRPSRSRISGIGPPLRRNTQGKKFLSPDHRFSRRPEFASKIERSSLVRKSLGRKSNPERLKTVKPVMVNSHVPPAKDDRKNERNESEDDNEEGYIKLFDSFSPERTQK